MTLREITLALRWNARCGEGPVWNGDRHLIHWVDILAGDIHTTNPHTMSTETITLPTLVGAAVPRRHGGFAAAVADGFAEIEAGEPMDVRAPVLTDGYRMNDAKCDSQGRLWAGSTSSDFTPGGGALWVLDKSWAAREVLDDLTLPNGLGWSPDDSTFYLADTTEREILAFDFDPLEGNVTNRRRFASFAESEGMPDGLCVDATGCLWVAMWGGARIIRIAPDGSRLETMAVPVEQPSSCAFIGPELSELLITSAAEGVVRSASDDHPDGSLLVLKEPGVRGLPSAPFAG